VAAEDEGRPAGEVGQDQLDRGALREPLQGDRARDSGLPGTQHRTGGDRHPDSAAPDRCRREVELQGDRRRRQPRRVRGARRRKVDAGRDGDREGGDEGQDEPDLCGARVRQLGVRMR